MQLEEDHNIQSDQVQSKHASMQVFLNYSIIGFTLLITLGSSHDELIARRLKNMEKLTLEFHETNIPIFTSISIIEITGVWYSRL